ncbi:tetratricopeptide repeat protein [Helicobacter bizzozeronii]|uniref:tetratricopeptide repeat protein n=1 Tax=Helicobacter bizzozeronii TaxID=56877 RepID=UPI0025558663|nr:tetratricopeptide repeat protein [Helicobacter bizzozeronii]
MPTKGYNEDAKILEEKFGMAFKPFSIPKTLNTEGQCFRVCKGVKKLGSTLAVFGVAKMPHGLGVLLSPMGFKRHVWRVFLVWVLVFGVSNADSQADTYYQLAKSYSHTRDYTQSIIYWEKLAELGDARGFYGLGYMYDLGYGVPQDYSKALKYYQRAAELGDARGYVSLGVMYANGHGVIKDDSKALQYFQKAADRGDAEGYNNLGLVYAKGVGVNQDYFKAIAYFQRAAELGSARGYHNLGVAYKFGLGVAKDEAKALLYVQKACAMGYQKACKPRQHLNRAIRFSQVLPRGQINS